MNEAIIKSVVTRCRSKDIEFLIRKWGCFSDEDMLQINFKAVKRRIAEDIFQLSQELRLKQEIGDLDLLCTQMHSSSRKWTVLKMKGFQMRMDLPPQDLQDRLTAILEAECAGHLHLNVKVYGGTTWIRVYIEGAAPFRAADVVYVVFYPYTPFLITCRMKVKMQEILCNALQEAFESEEIMELQLTGHHLPSLADLALSQSGQGPFRKYRDMEEAENPLLSSKTFKMTETAKRVMDPRLRDENRQQKQRRQGRLDNTFGTHTPPQLEKLEYQMDVKFRGTTFAPAMKDKADLFQCRVKIEGPSVLQGIKSLGSSGLANLPLPHHLSRVQTLAKNRFTITEMNYTRSRSSEQ